MRRNEHVSARVLALAGLAAGVAYLAWRAVWSMHGAPLLLAVPFYAVELFGFAGAAALVWALWPMPIGRDDEPPPVTRRVDAVVRVDDQFVHDVRASLLALRAVDGVDHLVIVDLSGRPAVASLATEFQCVYAATDTEDHNGLRVVAAAVRSPEFLLIDAGDVPATDIVTRLSLDLRDSAVAVVQGLGVSLADDSPEHGPNGRHELAFERGALNPGLGRRGVAVWLGSGSLVRTDALRDVDFSDAPSLEAHWSATSSLHSAGWKITAPSDAPVLSHRTIIDDAAVYRDRVRRTRAARHMLVGPRGVLRSPSYSPSQRLAAIAWSVRPLSSLRRVVFIAMLSTALLAGAVPFNASRFTLAVLWLPSFVYTALGLSLLSGWTLRPGDRTRWSLHNIGATLASFRDEPTTPRRSSRGPILALPSSQYGAGLIVAIVTLSVVLVLRGLSDRVTHTMGALPQSALVAMLVVTLWLLAISLDLLRVLARRAQLRRAMRVSTAFTATLGERVVSVLDLTALGAGVLSHTGLDVGEQMLLEMSVPTNTGVTSVRIPVEVRNVTMAPTGEWRMGLEFSAVDDATANALAEYCIIEPTWAQLGVLPGTSITEARPVRSGAEPAIASGAGRAVVRVVSLFALVGAIASSLPTTVEASVVLRHKWSGVVAQVIDPDATIADGARGVAGAVVTAICSTDPGADRIFGTIDDTYRSPVSALTNRTGRYELDLFGNACWSYVAPPIGYSMSPDAFDDVMTLDLRSQPQSHTDLVRDDSSGSAATAATGAAVRDQIWADQNGNGVRDSNEVGLRGVSVTLLDQVGHAIARQETGVDGQFVFSRVPAGRYRVSVSNLPGGLSFTRTAAGDGSTVDSAVDVFTGRTPLVAVHAGDQHTAPDVGLRPGRLDVGLRPSALVEPPTASAASVFPQPAPEQIVEPAQSHTTLSLLVLVIVAILGGSLLVGLARPRRGAMV